MKKDDCIFCKIINKKEFAAILYENDDIIAFIDIHPVNPGHILIVPKKHAELVHDLDKETFLKLFPLAYKIAKRIKEVYPETTAFNYLIADGVDAGQEIPHVHLHVIPRKPDDGFSFKLSKDFLSRHLSESDLESVKKNLLPI